MDEQPQITDKKSHRRKPPEVPGLPPSPNTLGPRKRRGKKFQPVPRGGLSDPLADSQLIRLLSAATSKPLPELRLEAARLWLASHRNDTCTFEQALHLNRQYDEHVDTLVRLVMTKVSCDKAALRRQATKLLLGQYARFAHGLERLVVDGYVKDET